MKNPFFFVPHQATCFFFFFPQLNRWSDQRCSVRNPSSPDHNIYGGYTFILNLNFVFIKPCHFRLNWWSMAAQGRGRGSVRGMIHNFPQKSMYPAKSKKTNTQPTGLFVITWRKHPGVWGKTTVLTTKINHYIIGIRSTSVLGFRFHKL